MNMNNSPKFSCGCEVPGMKMFKNHLAPIRPSVNGAAVAVVPCVVEGSLAAVWEVAQWWGEQAFPSPWPSRFLSL